MNIVQDATQAALPGTAKQFLGTVQPRPLMQSIMYVAILGVLGIIGTVIGLSVIGVCFWTVCFKWPITWSLVSGIIGWLGTIVSVVGAGMIVSALSQGMVGRLVSNEESVTMAALAATPVLLAGILNIIPGIGGIIIFLAWIYAAVLYYLGSTVRFGQDKAIVVTIIYIIMGIVISMVFGLISAAVYSPGLFAGGASSLGGYGTYGGGYYGF